MKLLVLLLIVGVSGFAEGSSEDEQPKNRLKQGLIVGGVVVGGLVSWGLLKHIDHKLLERFYNLAEVAARRSRMPLARFAKVDVSNPPIYRLTAPDGSEHHILGTMHISNLSLSDFPKDSKLFSIFDQANILMPEWDRAGFTSYVNHKNISVFKHLQRRMRQPQTSLADQLGDQHWQKLSAMIADKPDIKPFEESIDKYLADLDRLSAGEVYEMLVDLGGKHASPSEGLMMDFQLIRWGREQQGKTIIGLENFKQGAVASRRVGEAMADVDDLKKLIDKGGIDHVTETVSKSVESYANGKIDETMELFRSLYPPRVEDALEKYLLDQRNIAWLESGKIQKNCVAGNKCLIFVGLGHLHRTDNNLLKLLKEQGYRVERL